MFHHSEGDYWLPQKMTRLGKYHTCGRTDEKMTRLGRKVSYVLMLSLEVVVLCRIEMHVVALLSSYL